MVQNADRSSQPILSKYDSPFDWPWTMVMMVNEARRIISYFEHVPEQAMPPESIWHSPSKCKQWIDEHSPFNKDRPGGGMLEFDEQQVERANG